MNYGRNEIKIASKILKQAIVYLDKLHIYPNTHLLQTIFDHEKRT